MLFGTQRNTWTSEVTDLERHLAQVSAEFESEEVTALEI